MSVELIALLGILAMFSIYGLLSSMECGVALLRFFPRLAAPAVTKRVTSPLWEVTDLFLIFGVLGMAVLFREGLTAVMEAALPILIIGTTALLLRAGLGIYLFYREERQPEFLLYTFALASYAVPLSLGAVGIYLLTGAPVWQTGQGGVLFGALCVGLAASSAGFAYIMTRNDAPVALVVMSRLLYTVLAALLAVVVLEVLRGSGSHLLTLPYAYLAVIAAGLVLVQAVLVAARKEWLMWWCMAGLVLLAPFLLGLANYPFLVFPELTLFEAFSGRQSGALITALTIGLPLLFVSVCAVAWRLTRRAGRT